MVTLDSDFESKLQEALLDGAEHEFVGKQGNLVHQAIQQAHEILREYGSRYDYSIEPIIESLGQVDIERTDNRLRIRVGWDYPAAPFFELGTSDHTVEGNPILSFVWEDPPAWVREQFDREGDGWRVFFHETEPSGIPESRFVRDALNWLRREIQR
jgi:hypothetical protein